MVPQSPIDPVHEKAQEMHSPNVFSDNCTNFLETLQKKRKFFFDVLGLELRVYTLSHSTSPFL
jgi:hypothetical protein